MLHKAKDFLGFFDLFGYSSFFYIAERKKYKTPFLGLVSLLIILSLIAISIIKIINLLNKNNVDPIISYYKLISKENKIPFNAFPLIFQIQPEEISTGESLDFYRSFTDSIYINNRKFEIFNNLKQCEFYDLSVHEKPVADFLNKTLFSESNFRKNFFCLNFFNFEKNSKSNKDLEFLAHEEPLKIGFNYCILGEDCYEREVLSDMIITFKLLNLDYDANLFNKSFLKFKINENIFTIKSKASIDLKLDKLVIKSYEDPVRISNGNAVTNEIYNVKIKLRENSQNEISLNNENKKIIHDLELNFFLSDTIEFYTRTYENLFGIFAQFGGLFSFVKFGSVFVHFFYEFYYCRFLFNFLFYGKERKFKLLQKRYFDKSLFCDFKRNVEFNLENKSSSFLIKEFESSLVNNNESAKVNKFENNNKSYGKIKENLLIKNDNLIDEEEAHEFECNHSINNFRNEKGKSNKKKIVKDKGNKQDLLLGSTFQENANNSKSKKSYLKIFKSLLKKGKEIKDEKYFIRRLFDMKNILLLVLTKFNLYDFYENDRFSKNYNDHVYENFHYSKDIIIQSNYEKTNCEFDSMTSDKCNKFNSKEVFNNTK